MMRITKTSLVVLLVLSFVTCNRASADISEAACLFLQIQPDARSRGMGEVSAALPENTAAFHSNPAGLVGVKRLSLQASRGQWLPELADDLWYHSIGLAAAIPDFGVLAFSFRQLDYGEIISVSMAGADTVDSYDRVYSLGFARRLNPRLAVGASIKLIDSKLFSSAGDELGDQDATGFAIDIGVLFSGVAEHLTLGFTEPDYENYAIDPYWYLQQFKYRHSRGFAFGLSLQNLGPNMAYADPSDSDPLPRNLKTGMAYRMMDTAPLGCTLAADVNLDLVGDNLVYNLGMEFNFFYLGDLRVGYIYDGPGDVKTLTFGFGLGPEKARLNFSLIPESDDCVLSKTKFLSLSVNF